MITSFVYGYVPVEFLEGNDPLEVPFFDKVIESKKVGIATIKSSDYTVDMKLMVLHSIIEDTVGVAVFSAEGFKVFTRENGKWKGLIV